MRRKEKEGEGEREREKNNIVPNIIPRDNSTMKIKLGVLLIIIIRNIK